MPFDLYSAISASAQKRTTTMSQHARDQERDGPTVTLQRDDALELAQLLLKLGGDHKKRLKEGGAQE